MRMEKLVSLWRDTKEFSEMTPNAKCRAEFFNSIEGLSNALPNPNRASLFAQSHASIESCRVSDTQPKSGSSTIPKSGAAPFMHATFSGEGDKAPFLQLLRAHIWRQTRRSHLEQKGLRNAGDYRLHFTFVALILEKAECVIIVFSRQTLHQDA